MIKVSGVVQKKIVEDGKDVLIVRIFPARINKEVITAEKNTCLIEPKTDVNYYMDDHEIFLGIVTLTICSYCSARSTCEGFYTPPNIRA